ncbi:MAG: branched-chain amino acid ABC transporter permease [Comamonadaceae bacterium]|nr:branched-chain amino acid ABC transporter permease [Comamonadaceae bacterium]
MRFIFKTNYEQDLVLVRHSGMRFWYSVLAVLVLAAPLVLPGYLVTPLTFILIYAIAGLGLMLLTGFTGLVSIGNAAFIAIGAYVEAWLSKRGVPFPVSMTIAAVSAGLVGIAVGLPALRTKGIYLMIATFACAVVVEEVLTRAESITGGNSGMTVGAISLFGFPLNTDARFYFLALAIAVAATLCILNLLRSPTGRAFIAIRDSEISAQSMGIHLAYYKTAAFAISALLAGIAGALYAHKLRFISPEQFTFAFSIELLMMMVIGGLGSIKGVYFGAAFWVVVQQMILMFKDYLPASLSNQVGLQPIIFGVILIAFIIFEPKGINGRWIKVRSYLEQFPYYRKGSHRRQKTYVKSERMR